MFRLSLNPFLFGLLIFCAQYVWAQEDESALPLLTAEQIAQLEDVERLAGTCDLSTNLEILALKRDARAYLRRSPAHSGKPLHAITDLQTNTILGCGDMLDPLQAEARFEFNRRLEEVIEAARASCVGGTH